MSCLTTPLRHEAPARGAPEVWAVPVSFATTRGISVDFFSSGYLDVSVPPLTFPIKIGIIRLSRIGFTHSGIPG